MQIIFTILFFLALFVEQNWAVLLVLLVAGYNAYQLWKATKEKKDYIERNKCFVVNGLGLAASIGLIIWSII